MREQNVTSKGFRGGISPVQAQRLRQQAKQTRKAARLAKVARWAKSMQAEKPGKELN